MAKIPFDVKYKPQIESGEYKVETREGRPVRIICWDKKSEKKYGYHIVALIEFGPQNEESTYYTIDGKGRLKDKEPDLFIVTPEPELTEFEKKLSDVVAYAISLSVAEPKKSTSEFVKEYAAELLELARKEFVKQGYVIEIKAFHDAVKRVNPEVKNDVSANIDLANFVHDLGERYPEVSFAKLTRIAKAAYDYGKAEALKDLPRWRIELGEMELAAYGIIGRGVASQENPRVYLNGRSIDLYSLEKLPGFKED